MTELNEMLKIADIHVDRIQMALTKIHNFLPLTKEKIIGISEEELLLTDFLVYRVGKLQDLLGTKIIDQFLMSLDEYAANLSMIDKINKLERLGIIEHADLWKEMRLARNHTAHEYPGHPELTVQYLHEVIRLAPKLIDILNKIKIRLNS
jgi:hypothetical protein